MCDFIFPMISGIGTHDPFMSGPSYVGNVFVLDKYPKWCRYLPTQENRRMQWNIKNRAWFCSVEIGDIALILAFKNGRNWDERPSYFATNRFSASCHLWFCHDSEATKMNKKIFKSMVSLQYMHTILKKKMPI